MTSGGFVCLLRRVTLAEVRVGPKPPNLASRAPAST